MCLCLPSILLLSGSCLLLISNPELNVSYLEAPAPCCQLRKASSGCSQTDPSTLPFSVCFCCSSWVSAAPIFKALAQGVSLNARSQEWADMGPCLLSQVKPFFPSDNSDSPQVTPTESESPHPHLMLPKCSCSVWFLIALTQLHQIPLTCCLVAKYPSSSPPPHLLASW